MNAVEAEIARGLRDGSDGHALAMFHAFAATLRETNNPRLAFHAARIVAKRMTALDAFPNVAAIMAGDDTPAQLILAPLMLPGAVDVEANVYAHATWARHQGQADVAEAVATAIVAMRRFEREIDAPREPATPTMRQQVQETLEGTD